MRHLATKMLRSIVVAVFLIAGAANLRAQELHVYDFNLTGTPAENADHLESLGFSGVVTRLQTHSDLVKLDDYALHAATMDDFDVLAFLPYDFDQPVNADVWIQALPTLASLDAPLWVIVRNAPSPLALRQLLRRMARYSEIFGVETVIYPHWDTDIESAEEAAALIASIGHSNLRNSLHTCHEIRARHQYELEDVVAQHAHETALVTLAGAEHRAYAGPPGPGIDWDDAIKPLDEGAFSLLPFLQALHDAGYDGPVILHTFGIVDNPGHLERSLDKYAEYLADIV